MLEEAGVRAGNGGKMPGMLGEGYDAEVGSGSVVRLTLNVGCKSTCPDAVPPADEAEGVVELTIRGAATAAKAGPNEALALKVDIPGGVTVGCDAATAVASWVTLTTFAENQTCGDWTRRKVFSLCRNGCEGSAPDRGARLVDKVERTSALVRDVSAPFIRAGKTGRMG